MAIELGKFWITWDNVAVYFRMVTLVILWGAFNETSWHSFFKELYTLAYNCAKKKHLNLLPNVCMLSIPKKRIQRFVLFVETSLVYMV